MVTSQRSVAGLCVPLIASAAIFLPAGCGDGEPQGETQPVTDAMELGSPAFADGEPIPQVHAYKPEGRNVSPQLSWRHPPRRAKEFALICEDPDAPYPGRPRPEGPWVHWLVYKIPAELRALPRDLPAIRSPAMPAGVLQGVNDFGEVGYGGPLPPPDSPAHRYVFALYALDRTLDLEPGLTKRELMQAMNDAVIGRAELVGTYER